MMMIRIQTRPSISMSLCVCTNHSREMVKNSRKKGKKDNAFLFTFRSMMFQAAKRIKRDKKVKASELYPFHTPLTSQFLCPFSVCGSSALVLPLCFSLLISNFFLSLCQIIFFSKYTIISSFILLY